MAVQVLAVAATRGEVAEFTLAAQTLVWVHGANGDNVLVGVNIKGSDGKFQSIAEMTADGQNRSGTLPAGDYQVVRLRGTCGFQRAA